MSSRGPLPLFYAIQILRTDHFTDYGPFVARFSSRAGATDGAHAARGVALGSASGPSTGRGLFPFFFEFSDSPLES